MIEIKFDKLYRYDRINEPCFIGFPLKKGELYSLDKVAVYQEDKRLPVQAKITSTYEDNSIRFLFLRFLADLPGNEGLTLKCELEDESASQVAAFDPIETEKFPDGYLVKTVNEGGEPFSFRVKNGSDSLLSEVKFADNTLSADRFEGPVLKDKKGNSYSVELGSWSLVEAGPVCTILKAKGRHNAPSLSQTPEFEVKLTAFAGKSTVEVSYRIINTTDEPLEIESLEYSILRKEGAAFDKVRTIAASSNYKTSYTTGENGSPVSRVVDADMLMKEANEHFAEVFYGTFFADCTDEKYGVSATVFQAQQNFPKAVYADGAGIRVSLVPADTTEVTLFSGVSREQKFLLHFHSAEMEVDEINNRSIIYQMPDRPYVSPVVQRESGVWPDIFPTKIDYKFEQNMISRADAHCRAYGMLNFGDSYDSNYTAQGRGGGKLVYCNNEYDFPHACALLYARTGIRRFLDYNIAACSHWMDVDVCHYHKDPLYIGGQWEHTAGHVIDGVMVCSHEWVEGLLDYYHFTGDERGLETAIGIGDNVNRLLDTPMYAKAGEINARETGWALRTLTALYIETHDKKWLKKCDRIVNDFRVWEDMYGHWLAPYTDNTLIRVGFMISVAVGSLMRYYRVFPDEELKDMILRAVDDLIENCYVKEWGIFYYKELPSLNRVGTNTLLLEALTAAYDLTKEKSYLDYGIETFNNAIAEKQAYSGSSKKKEDNAVIVGSVSSKAFAQSMIPIAGFYRALTEND
jgi:hypothetical protein